MHDETRSGARLAARTLAARTLAAWSEYAARDKPRQTTAYRVTRAIARLAAHAVIAGSVIVGAWFTIHVLAVIPY